MWLGTALSQGLPIYVACTCGSNGEVDGMQTESSFFNLISRRSTDSKNKEANVASDMYIVSVWQVGVVYLNSNVTGKCGISELDTGVSREIKFS